MSSSSEEESPL
jgi:ATP-dependent RNA helicase DDX47/RRP3